MTIRQIVVERRINSFEERPKYRSFLLQSPLDPNLTVKRISNEKKHL